ncbi:PDR_assoc domain-containing protein, partial [Cephalotus follicularis]
WVWAFWLSPLAYGQCAISVNEFTATRWMEVCSEIQSFGYNILHSHSLPDGEYWYWLGVGILLLYALLFNYLVTVALSYLNRKLKNEKVLSLSIH